GCRHLHPALDALAAILEKAPLTAAQVERITVGTYRAAVDTEIHQLKSRGDAYFNLSYAMAARIVLGHNDYDAFAEEHFTNPRILALMPRIRVAVEPQIDALYPKKRGALVELQTVAGGGLRKEILIARGEPENPLPDAFTRHKFRKAAADCLIEGEQAEIEAVLADDCSLDTSALFTGLTRILTNTQGSKHAA
ncbi:MAG: MmgE/PrpD family protein, partial [Desulfuromonadales bacterium]|nr:MmgE/PrpD family protein [Desulfuromonadales bacterium]